MSLWGESNGKPVAAERVVPEKGVEPLRGVNPDGF